MSPDIGQTLYGPGARKFFERQQAVRREHQRQARPAEAETGAASRYEPERAGTAAGNAAEAFREEPAEAFTDEPAEAFTEEPAELSAGGPSTLPHERPVADAATTELSTSRRAATGEHSPYVLRVGAGDAPASRFALTYGSMTIGRQPGSDILLHDPMVSHVHAVIETTPDRVTIQDKDSSNGTLVNGVEISETTEMQPGDTVLIGDVLLRFERASADS
jgi:Inner membrane component of T3SS, cytoplasmic domain